MENYWAIGLLLLNQRKDIQLLAEMTAAPWNRPAAKPKVRPLRSLNLTRLLAAEPDPDSVCVECCLESC
jgi:hypothetical protein